MTIELPKDVRQQAISSIERYFQENMDEKIGNIAAGGLLGFFVEEIGPVIYNMAVAEVQERLQTASWRLILKSTRTRFNIGANTIRRKRRSARREARFSSLLCVAL